MKTAQRLILLLTTIAVAFVSCEKNNTTNNGGGNGVVDNTAQERVIVYTVGDSENLRTLETEAEWDAMIDLLCEQAYNGNEVTLYNINQTTRLQGTAKGTAKDNRTINTTNREEIRTWMKEMEKQGLTVRISYDDGTGTWRGVAYATMPADNTSGLLAGTWQFNRMVITHVGTDGSYRGSDLYEPEAGTMYYTFSSDGTVTMTMHGMDGTNATESGTWTLSDDGVLSSELLPNGVVWNVNWITRNTMVLSHGEMGGADGDFYYQLQFESTTGVE